MMIEGHACLVQELVAKELKLDESHALLIQRMNADNDKTLTASGRGSWDRYVNGKRFMDAIYARGGLSEVQKTFLNPPTSRRMIIDPELYRPGRLGRALIR